MSDSGTHLGAYVGSQLLNYLVHSPERAAKWAAGGFLRTAPETGSMVNCISH
jgi:hypothetical protein